MLSDANMLSYSEMPVKLSTNLFYNSLKLLIIFMYTIQLCIILC